jgi:hypothetical protein
MLIITVNIMINREMYRDQILIKFYISYAGYNSYTGYNETYYMFVNMSTCLQVYLNINFQWIKQRKTP